MEWRSDPQNPKQPQFTRRRFVVGAAVGGGLALGFALWPRRYLPNVTGSPDESIFNAFLKIGSDGHIVVIVPQVELGQGCTTLLPQIVADELGADWRTIGVEPAPLNPLYANTVFAEAYGWNSVFDPWPAPLLVTDEALTLAAFAEPMRQAAALVRDLLCRAAAAQWGVASGACESVNGFVTQGKNRARFGDLAVAAARLRPDETPILRQGEANRLIGTSLPRLDAPAKIDGSVTFATDIRLPEMVFATLHQGPFGDTRLADFDEAGARRVAGAVDVVALAHTRACVGETSWVAAKMLAAGAPRFAVAGAAVDSSTLDKRLDAALGASGTRKLALGDVDTALASGHAESASYHIGLLAPHALEPLAATARYEKGQLEIWTSAQAPEQARQRAARASGIGVRNIFIHTVRGGGSFGRRFDLEIVDQVAELAVKLKRPVQLFWSRGEDMMQARFGGGAAARMSAQALPDGRINAWLAHVSLPAASAQLQARMMRGASAMDAVRAAAGTFETTSLGFVQPPYSIPHFACETHMVDPGVPMVPLRGGAGYAMCFFNESFINELSAKTGVEPFSFRMALIGTNTRLAQCLAKVSALGGWGGGAQGSNQGIACFMSQNAAIAVIAEAAMGEQGQVRVTKLTAVADVGQAVNPEIARQHIEGGLLFGLGLAVGKPVGMRRGVAGPIRMGELGLPRLADAPEIAVELVPSSAPAADAWDIAVPPVAPAIAGALFAGSGKRFRRLPFSAGGN